MNVTIIGTGYVGLVTGTCLAELGHEVLCVDIDEKKVAQLQSGEIPLYEQGLEKLVHANQSAQRLNFTSDLEKGVEFADIVICAVGTPQSSTNTIDLSAVWAVTSKFGQLVKKHTLFVNKSTVPVGTTEKINELIYSELENRGKSHEEAQGLFDIAYNPEFLREGTAVEDFLNPHRIVIGTEKDQRGKTVQQKMTDLYKSFNDQGVPLLMTDIQTAEVMKQAANTFLATKISFINEIANFCDAVGADVEQVAEGMGLDPRISKSFLRAGLGYGGSCLPKDVKMLIRSGEDHHYDFHLLKAVESVNVDQPLRVIEKLKEVYPELKGLTLAIWGLTFKPNTDDMREAPSIRIVNELRQAGAQIRVFDPAGMEKARPLLGNEVVYATDAYAALDQADALILLTEWEIFKNTDLEEVKKRLKKAVVIDGRNVYDRRVMESIEFHYLSIGS